MQTRQIYSHCKKGGEINWDLHGQLSNLGEKLGKLPQEELETKPVVQTTDAAPVRSVSPPLVVSEGDDEDEDEDEGEARSMPGIINKGVFS